MGFFCALSRCSNVLHDDHPPTATTPANRRYWALIACLLSVQCRDVVALSVARKFMAKHPLGATAVASLSEAQIEDWVRRCNFYKTKAKNVAACTAAMLKLHDGTAPSSYASLIALPGVGPKIAHLVSLVFALFSASPLDAAAQLSPSMLVLLRVASSRRCGQFRLGRTAPASWLTPTCTGSHGCCCGSTATTAPPQSGRGSSSSDGSRRAAGPTLPPTWYASPAVAHRATNGLFQ